MYLVCLVSGVLCFRGKVSDVRVCLVCLVSGVLCFRGKVSVMLECV